MIAVDTNLIVRYLMDDDPEQAQQARAVIGTREVFIPTTVLLETEWVLRCAYGRERQAVITALRGLVGLPRLVLENPPLVARALDWADNGMDFADALHLSAADGCDSFLTFDRQMIRVAPPGSATVRAPPG